MECSAVVLFCSFSSIKSQDQILRSCATFAMGAPCRAALRLGSQWQSSNHQQSTRVTWIKIFFRSSSRSNRTLVVLKDTSWNGGPGRKWQATDRTRSSKSVGFQGFNDAAAQPSRFRKIKIWSENLGGSWQLEVVSFSASDPLTIRHPRMFLEVSMIFLGCLHKISIGTQTITSPCDLAKAHCPLIKNPAQQAHSLQAW